jgi:hypothetical protein
MTRRSSLHSRPGRSTRWGLVVASLAAVLGLLGGLAPAGADVNVITPAGGFAASVTASLLGITVPGTPVTLAPTTGQANGTPQNANVASVNLPTVLTTGILTSSTQGGNLGTHQGFSTSNGQVAGATVLNGPLAGFGVATLLTADVLAATCTSTGTGSTGSSTLTNLVIAGIPIAVNTPPNTVISVLNLAGVVVTVTVNEQIVVNTPGVETSMIVNAVHVHAAVAPLGVNTVQADVVLGHAACRAAGPDVLIVTPPTTPTNPSVPAGAINVDPRFAG